MRANTRSVARSMTALSLLAAIVVFGAGCACTRAIPTAGAPPAPETPEGSGAPAEAASAPALGSGHEAARTPCCGPRPRRSGSSLAGRPHARAGAAGPGAGRYHLDRGDRADLRLREPAAGGDSGHRRNDAGQLAVRSQAHTRRQGLRRKDLDRLGRTRPAPRRSPARATSCSTPGTAGCASSSSPTGTCSARRPPSRISRRPSGRRSAPRMCCASARRTGTRSGPPTRPPGGPTWLASYRILLLIGDDFGDFAYLGEVGAPERLAAGQQYASYWGTRWVILPNAMYGTWEEALYGHDSRLPDSTRLRLKYEALRSAE